MTENRQKYSCNLLVYLHNFVTLKSQFCDFASTKFQNFKIYFHKFMIFHKFVPSDV